jgi:hypothetical protein
MLVHGVNNPTTTAQPDSAMANTNVVFKPSMYASRIPGNIASSNLFLMSVAPTAMTTAGSSDGVYVLRPWTSLLLNAL